jgi:hypothetical protein
LNSTSGLLTGPLACADYYLFNRATFYASFANGPTIVNGTFLYTNSSLTTAIPDGYYSDGTTYWFFQNGSTGDNGNPCNTTTTTTTAAPTTTTTTVATTTTTTTLAYQSYDLYFPCGTTTPADQRVVYTGNQSPGEIILASNGLCYTIVGPTTVGGATNTIISEHSTCEDCEAARPTTTTTTTAAPTTTTTTLLLTANGTYECSLGTACDGVFNISSVTGGSGAPYQTSYVVTGNPPSWNNYPATNSYTGLCGGTSYTFSLKGSAGDTRTADPNTQCSYTTTTTTAAPTTTTTIAPTCTEYRNDNTFDVTLVDYTTCAGTVLTNQTLYGTITGGGTGQSICAQDGSLGGTGAAYLTNVGSCT